MCMLPTFSSNAKSIFFKKLGLYICMHLMPSLDEIDLKRLHPKFLISRQIPHSCIACVSQSLLRKIKFNFRKLLEETKRRNMSIEGSCTTLICQQCGS